MNENSETLSIVTLDDLKFYVRDGSSDAKSLKEVVEKLSYARKSFPLGDKQWIDFGANIGAFTVLVAKRHGAHVLAFEPDRASCAILRMNVELNDIGHHVEVREQAVLPKMGKVTFYVNSARKNYWRNSVVKPWKGGYAIEVEGVTLSSIPLAGKSVKLDVEGSEMPLLESLTTFPQRLVFEWSFDIDHSIPRFKAVIERMRGHYANVVYGKFDETKSEWQGSWFPPCRTVWCW